MKKSPIFTIFIAAFVWTVGFSSLAVIAGKKSQEQAPEIFSRLHDTFGVRFNADHFNISYSSSDSDSEVDTEDKWLFSGKTTKKVSLKTVSGDIEIKQAPGNEEDIKVTATGRLNRNLAHEILQIKEEGGEVTLKDANNDAAADLHIVVEIPAPFAEEMEIEGKSVSGDIQVLLEKFRKLDLSTISGDVRITLKAGNEVELKLKTISGDIDNAFPSHGRGSHKVEVKTVSGDIKVSGDGL